MKKAVTILLSGGYLCLSLALAAIFWRADAGWGAGAAVLVGSLGLLFGLHNMMSRGMSAGELRREIASLSNAHGLLAEQLEETQAALEAMADSLHRETDARAQALTSEVRLLEDLVARLGDTLDEELAAMHARTGLPGVSSHGGHDPQTTALLHAVREALAENRVDLYLQPVVSLPQRRTVYYESYTRLRDTSGRVMMPGEFMSVAEPGGLISTIDNLLLLRCVQVVRRFAKQDRKIGIFCNISLTSLGDETFFPQFLEFMSKNRDLSGSVIFELGQDSFDRRSALEQRNMGRLADLGFRFSIDKVETLDFNFADLARSEVKFVKVGADVLLSSLLDDDNRRTIPALRDLHYADYAALTRRYGVELVAEKIEHERQVVDILDLDVAFAQGHLFGEPRAIRESILAEAETPEEPVVRRGTAALMAGQRAQADAAADLARPSHWRRSST
jgi:cyclic-di-GMP phosphodiesterase, flagellum assembly factor TipF